MYRSSRTSGATYPVSISHLLAEGRQGCLSRGLELYCMRQSSKIERAQGAVHKCIFSSFLFPADIDASIVQLMGISCRELAEDQEDVKVRVHRSRDGAQESCGQSSQQFAGSNLKAGALHLNLDSCLESCALRCT